MRITPLSRAIKYMKERMLKSGDINEDLPKSFKIFLALQEEVRREIASADVTSQSDEGGEKALSTA